MPMSTLAERREFLLNSGFGLGGVALTWLLAQDQAQSRAQGAEATVGQSALRPKISHFTPRA
ncbi:MAG: DUF1501 domain-containing protein, partial [Planctomycetaceae bacterium]